MGVVLTHPTGNEFFRATAEGLLNAGILSSVYTSVANFPGDFLYNAASFKIFSDIKRRSLDKAFKNITHTHPLKEVARLLAIKTGVKILTSHEKGIFSVDSVYRSLDKYVAQHLYEERQKGAGSVYAYEDGAYCTFKKAKALHVKCLYDLPIGYWRSMHKVLAEEKELNPEWASTLEGLRDSKDKLDRKDEELRLANKVFVASSFTASTLKMYPGNLPPIQVIPYGFPSATGKEYKWERKKIKLLFVGGLSQRKGISYLFKAVEGLESYIELTVVGRPPQTTCEPLNRELRKYAYLNSLPHSEILELMRTHDVLVFPSLFEGFGQVISEAMAQGTPVITTERTAGPDLITHGKNGWLVKAGSSTEIKKILDEIISNRDIIKYAGAQALETAKKRPWRVYGEELAKAIMEIEN